MLLGTLSIGTSWINKARYDAVKNLGSKEISVRLKIVHETSDWSRDLVISIRGGRGTNTGETVRRERNCGSPSSGCFDTKEHRLAAISSHAFLGIYWGYQAEIASKTSSA